MKKYINVPVSGKDKDIERLQAGDMVFLSGVVHTARDQAHKRISGLLKRGKKLPIKLYGQAVYYCGPTPAKPGMVIGACGPTTSSRMDPFSRIILDAGVKILIGKGRRGDDVKDYIRKKKAVYLVAPAGCGAYLSEKVISSEIKAFKDLGPEAIFRLQVKDFPVVVAIDSKGDSIYG